MKYIKHDNRQFVLYIHVFINLEGWGYKLEPYPQSDKPKLKDWQIKILMEELQKEANQNSWALRQ